MQPLHILYSGTRKTMEKQNFQLKVKTNIKAKLFIMSQAKPKTRIHWLIFLVKSVWKLKNTYKINRGHKG